MQGADGWAIEAQESAPLEDSVEDRLCQVLIVEDAAPRFQCLLVVKIIGRWRRWRSFTTWKSIFAASVPYVR